MELNIKENKQPPAEAGERVGSVTISDFRGYENVEFQYSGNLPNGTHSLYTSQTTATQAAVAAAMRKCADILEEWAKLAMEYGFDGDAEEFRNIKGEILERIPAEANAALDAYVQEKCIEVANEMNTIKSIVDDDSIYRIVTSVIEKGK